MQKGCTMMAVEVLEVHGCGKPDGGRELRGTEGGRTRKGGFEERWDGGNTTVKLRRQGGGVDGV